MVAFASTALESAAQAKPARRQAMTWKDRFLKLLPDICEQARHAFRKFDQELREDAIQEVIASAFAAYARLVERGKEAIAYVTPLAQYAIKQYLVGRRLGSSLNVLDVMSRHCQRNKGVQVERLSIRNTVDNQWHELLVEDRKTGPAEIATMKIDFPAWLRSLSPTVRRIAKALAAGERTSVVAKMFGVTPGRISQLRAFLRDHWQAFHGEAVGQELLAV